MVASHRLSQCTTQLESLRLRAAIRQGLGELETQLRRTHTLETQLNAFADAYFAALGNSLNRLARTAHVPSSHEAARLSALNSQHHANQYAIKQSYRQIMKRLHPDCAPAAIPAHTDTMAAAQNAYKAQDLASLVCIEIALSPPPIDAPNAGLDALQAKLEKIGAALHDAESRYARLTQSALYACWQRAEMERIAGRNWIAAISARIKAEMRPQSALLSAA
jgi:DnaJ-domain-containing protein 1